MPGLRRSRSLARNGPWPNERICQHHGAKRLADPGRAVDAPMYQVVKSGVAGEGMIALKILPGWSAGAASWWSARAGFRPHAFGWIAWSLTTVWPPEPTGIRDCVRSGGFSASMMPVRGARRGASSGRLGATPSPISRLSSQVSAMSGHAEPRRATAWDCLLSSRSRVRVAVGAQVKILFRYLPRRPGATRGVIGQAVDHWLGKHQAREGSATTLARRGRCYRHVPGRSNQRRTAPVTDGKWSAMPPRDFSAPPCRL